MVSLSPKRLRSRILDRFKQGTSRQQSSKQVAGRPIPIFETTLAKATIASRIDGQPPAHVPASAGIDSSSNATIDHLDALYRYWCPAVVYRCLTHLTRQGLDEEGLYRVPGSSETIKLLRREFNCRGDVALDAFAPENGQHGLQLADVASLLKQFLRELPAPIMSTETVRTLEAAMNDTAALRHTLSTFLAPYEFYLLSMLCRHLAMVAAHSSSNKMDMHNLSIVFCSSSNLGIGTTLFAALAKEDVWTDLRCTNEENAIMKEQESVVVH